MQSCGCHRPQSPRPRVGAIVLGAVVGMAAAASRLTLRGKNEGERESRDVCGGRSCKDPRPSHDFFDLSLFPSLLICHDVYVPRSLDVAASIPLYIPRLRNTCESCGTCWQNAGCRGPCLLKCTLRSITSEVQAEKTDEQGARRTDAHPASRDAHPCAPRYNCSRRTRRDAASLSVRSHMSHTISLSRSRVARHRPRARHRLA